MKINRFGKAEVLSTAELDLLLSVLPENHRVLATLLRRTAARVSEGLQLRWRYVGDGYVLLTAPTVKGGRKTRTVPLHPELEATLMAWARVVNPDNNPDQWVFPSARCPGESMSRRAFDHALRKACAELNLRGFSTHGFRRSFLTSAHQAGVPLRNLQAISGHASLNQISVYLEVPEQAKTDAVMLSA